MIPYRWGQAVALTVLLTKQTHYANRKPAGESLLKHLQNGALFNLEPGTKELLQSMAWDIEEKGSQQHFKRQPTWYSQILSQKSLSPFPNQSDVQEGSVNGLTSQRTLVRGSSFLISSFILFHFFRTLRVENNLLCQERKTSKTVLSTMSVQTETHLRVTDGQSRISS